LRLLHKNVCRIEFYFFQQQILAKKETWFTIVKLNLTHSSDIHLPVEGWLDARIGQSLEINISLTIAKS